MRYQESIHKSIQFIQNHLDEDLTAEKIANHVGYSVFHFCRIFSLETGVPLMQYVRQCRLNHARQKLGEEMTVLDVALKYGFESASGFSKSFRKEFGYSPTSYRVRMRNVDSSFLLDISQVIQPPKLMQLDQFWTAGYTMELNIEDALLFDAACWDNYQGVDLETKLYEQVKPCRHGEIGMCLSSEGGRSKYFFGVLTDQLDNLPAELTTVKVTGGLYAVFTTPPVNNTVSAETYDKDPLSIAVKETWRYIFTQWLGENQYYLDQSRECFEFYDERCHGLENAIAEIYIPVSERQEQTKQL
ncbi:MAG: AraC family transcriptional regulator [Massiliimalia sp.]|jgi:AraC family transcriptional regulator